MFPRARGVGEGSPRDGKTRTTKRARPSGRSLTVSRNCGHQNLACRRRAAVFQGFPDQCGGSPTVIEKTGGFHSVGFCQEIGEVDTVKKRAPTISLQRLGRIEDVIEALGTPGRDDQNSEASFTDVLKLVVELDSSLPAIGVSLRSHRFRRIIDFDDEVVRVTSGHNQPECTVREQGFVADGKPNSVLSAEVRHSNVMSVRADDRVDDEIGETPRVVLVQDADFVEISLRRWLFVASVQDAVAGERQLVIGR